VAEFLMGEVPLESAATKRGFDASGREALHGRVDAHHVQDPTDLAACRISARTLQGYLNYKKTHPPGMIP
jgi:hypothetical protein